MKKERLNLLLAISLYTDKSVTLEKAVELARKPLANFIEIHQSKGIPWMHYTEENIEEDDLNTSPFYYL